jgi:hypothetical protein
MRFNEVRTSQKLFRFASSLMPSAQKPVPMAVVPNGPNVASGPVAPKNPADAVIIEIPDQIEIVPEVVPVAPTVSTIPSGPNVPNGPTFNYTLIILKFFSKILNVFHAFQKPH